MLIIVSHAALVHVKKNQYDTTSRLKSVHDVMLNFHQHCFCRMMYVSCLHVIMQVIRYQVQIRAFEYDVLDKLSYEREVVHDTIVLLAHLGEVRFSSVKVLL